MRVVFKTNLDKYQKPCFPKYDNPISVPRVGDYVCVVTDFYEYYKNKKLPTRMIVTSVTWFEDEVICDLWYTQRDIDLAKFNEVDLFN
jgi:hypothetical protein